MIKESNFTSDSYIALIINQWVHLVIKYFGMREETWSRMLQIFRYKCIKVLINRDFFLVANESSALY